MPTYIESANIRVFPCAYRSQQSATTVYDPEARAFTERNLTHLAKGLRSDSYIISWDGTSGDELLRCVIGGYYFEISEKPLQHFNNKYLCIKPTKQISIGDNSTYVLDSFDSYTDFYLDRTISGTSYFTGLSLESSVPTGCVGLQITADGSALRYDNFLPDIKAGKADGSGAAIGQTAAYCAGELAIGKYNENDANGVLFAIGDGTSSAAYDIFKVTSASSSSGRTAAFKNAEIKLTGGSLSALGGANIKAIGGNILVGTSSSNDNLELDKDGQIFFRGGLTADTWAFSLPSIGLYHSYAYGDSVRIAYEDDYGIDVGASGFTVDCDLDYTAPAGGPTNLLQLTKTKCDVKVPLNAQSGLTATGNATADSLTSNGAAVIKGNASIYQGLDLGGTHSGSSANGSISVKDSLSAEKVKITGGDGKVKSESIETGGIVAESVTADTYNFPLIYDGMTTPITQPGTYSLINGGMSGRRLMLFVFRYEYSGTVVNTTATAAVLPGESGSNSYVLTGIFENVAAMPQELTFKFANSSLSSIQITETPSSAVSLRAIYGI